MPWHASFFAANAVNQLVANMMNCSYYRPRKQYGSLSTVLASPASSSELFALEHRPSVAFPQYIASS